LARRSAAETRLYETRKNASPTLVTRKAALAVRRANVGLARAQLEQAELNLSYAKVYAPVAGVVGKKSVNVGDRINGGQPLLAVTNIERLWVTANFRETQLSRMEPGQRVSLHVDALGREYQGVVESIAAATGARYSLLPPENATGNYVKVVQRLPVRIALANGQPQMERLRPGMSVEPSVRVR
jgi:membrane fusion protein (multidrug efflux system)